MSDPLDILFTRLRTSPFAGVDPNSVPQEGKGDIEATGFVNVVENADRGVVIDKDGITINFGSLTIKDSSGGTVMTAAGFSGAWLSFLASGFYNGDFAFGTTNNITAATIVGTASTAADYLASLSDDLPYWVVSSESGAGSLQRVADAAAPSGYALRWTGTEDAEVFQDVPITPGQNYAVWFSWKHTDDSEFLFDFSTQFRDEDHAGIGSAIAQSTNGWNTSMVDYEIDKPTDLSGFAPMNARYMRVSFHFSRLAGTPTIDISQVFLERGTSYAQMQHYGFGLEIRFPQGSGYTTPAFEITNQGTLFWNDPFGVVDGAGLYLRSDSELALTGTLTAPPKLDFRESGGAWDYIQLDAPNSRIKIGDGSAAPDVYISRSAAEELTIADASGGELSSGVIVKAANIILDVSGAVLIGAAGAGNIADGLRLGLGSIELAAGGGTPFIDFKNDLTGTDFDARIILVSDDYLRLEGITRLQVGTGAVEITIGDYDTTHERGAIFHSGQTGSLGNYVAGAGGAYVPAVSWGANATQPLLAFYGTAPLAKVAVTGSRGGNAALANLMTALANLGLVTNSTT